MQKLSDMIDFRDEDFIKLKQNFIIASKDTKFKKLVGTLSSNEEILMKYTSSLEDSAEEFDNCLNCPGLDFCKNKIEGYLLTPVEEESVIHFDYIACPYLRKKIKEEEYLNNIELFQISKSLKKASIKNIETNDKERLNVLRYFKQFLDEYKNEDKPKGIYLNGSFGTGKTYLIAALFNELAKRNIRSAIVYYPEFLRSLKESFDTNYKEKFNYVKKVPVLLIDDIGAEGVTIWSRDEILGSILQYRMEENLPTFFTSNLTLEELEEHLSLSSKGVERVKARRIVERIKFMCIDIKLISQNRRK